MSLTSARAPRHASNWKPAKCKTWRTRGTFKKMTFLKTGCCTKSVQERQQFHRNLRGFLHICANPFISQHHKQARGEQGFPSLSDPSSQNLKKKKPQTALEKPGADEYLVLRCLCGFKKLLRCRRQILYQLPDDHLLLSGPGQAVVHCGVDWHTHGFLLQVGQPAGGGRSS